MRRDGVTLRMEHVERVDHALREPERVESNDSRFGVVHAAQVDHEFSIDEHPQVIVAGKRKRFAPLVLELSVNLRGEVEVVVVAFIAETESVQREERSGLEAVD